MPFFASTKVSFKGFVEKTFNKRTFKASRISKDSSNASQLSFEQFPKQRLVLELDIGDAYHDPTVLDVRRNLVYGLNDFGSEIDQVTVMDSPAGSRSLLSPSLAPTVVVDEPIFKVIEVPLPPVQLEVIPTALGLGDSVPPPLASVVTEPASVDSSVLPRSHSRVMTLSDLQLLKVLGKGASGQVYMVKDKVTSERRALKVVPNAKLGAGEIATLLEEQFVLKGLGSAPFLMSLDASFYDTKNFYLILPMHPTDVESEICRCKKLTKARSVFYFAEAYVGLSYLHSEGIIHRDIKPANMLIDREGHIVLCDFGLARNFDAKPTTAERVYQPFWPYSRSDVITPATRRRSGSDPALLFNLKAVCGTGLHMAPELLNGEWYSFGVDIWALGISLYMMLTGRPPFDTASDHFDDLKKVILESDVQFVSGDDIDDVSQTIVRHLLEKDPEDRLRLTELEEHPFFEGINWPLLEMKAVAAPWIPTPEPGHILHEQVDPFVPGVPFDGAGPYPQFNYMSEDVKHCIIREEDLMSNESVYEAEAGLELDDITDCLADSDPAQTSPLKAFFTRLLRRKDSINPQPGTPTTPIPAPVETPTTRALTDTPSLHSISSSPWLGYDGEIEPEADPDPITWGNTIPPTGDIESEIRMRLETQAELDRSLDAIEAEVAQLQVIAQDRDEQPPAKTSRVKAFFRRIFCVSAWRRMRKPTPASASVSDPGLPRPTSALASTSPTRSAPTSTSNSSATNSTSIPPYILEPAAPPPTVCSDPARSQPQPIHCPVNTGIDTRFTAKIVTWLQSFTPPKGCTIPVTWGCAT
ncbi:hypothetical protein H0H81_011711 [Sphagnurus paluster]|uniref:Protein kinase domain-containing protein n=1 Tax=Sphagnurus paluster TaxID=117069 RepID=A0A9P7KHH1_9AGAR|nr:hypothetical protein H0H81_011711 [Sphagnurus paluster]